MLADAVSYATLFGVLLTAAGVFQAIRVYRRQMNAQLFLAYTQRYDEIMGAFPADARGLRLDLTGDPPPESPELRLAVLRYLNLCSEEFYLYRRGYLARDIWKIWEKELERTLSSPLLLREWPAVRNEFEANAEFARYVGRVQENSPPSR